LTSEARVIDVPGLPRFEIAPHHCFACGTLNTHGLHLDLHVERGRSWVELTYEGRFQGWDGIAHGGILATILDEVMAWALVGEDDWGLTARLAIDFKQPVKVGQRIRAEGWITRSRRRIVDTEATVTDARTGELLATATGVYMAADDARRRELRARYGWRPLDDDQAADGVEARETPEAVDAHR
jgi:acyl-coenzyme A thioesterase PaaI-like protein